MYLWEYFRPLQVALALCVLLFLFGWKYVVIIMLFMCMPLLLKAYCPPFQSIYALISDYDSEFPAKQGSLMEWAPSISAR